MNMKFKWSISVVFWLFVFCTFSSAKAASNEISNVAKAIRETKPLQFAFLKPVNPWSRDSNVNLIHGEMHRLYLEFDPDPGSFEAQVLARLNDPANRTFYLLRQYLAYVRKIVFEKKSPDDRYSLMQPGEPIYLLHTNISGKMGPMVQINIANLILPATWATRNPFEARPADGKVIYDYILLADGLEKTVSDIWNDRRFFDALMVHMSLLLMEAEARGQKHGLQAHVKAHSLPEVHLAFGNTWCQTRAFFEGWSVSQRAFLNRLFPRVFSIPDLTALRELDRFLYFSKDPFREDFEPLVRVRSSWNTPQALFSSHYVTAFFLEKILTNEHLENPWNKAFLVLTKLGAGNLRDFIRDWIILFPEDQVKIKAVFQRVVQDSVFSCFGPDIWVGIPPSYDHVNFNASTLEDMVTLLSRLAERMPLRERHDWIYFKNQQGNVENAIVALSQAIIAERGRRCGQFRDILDLSFFITRTADQMGMKRSALMAMLRVVREANLAIDQSIEAEKARLVKIGAYQP